MSDATKEQIIRIVIQDADARRKTAERHTEERKQIKQTGDAQVKADKAVEKAQRDLRAEVIKQTKTLDAMLAKSAKDRTATAKAEANARIKTEKNESSERARSAKDINAFLRQLDAETTRNRKSEAAKQTADAKAALRKELQDMAINHKFRMTQFQLEQNSLKAQRAEWQAMTGGVGSYVAAFASVGAVTGVLKSWSDYMSQLKKETFESVAATLDYRDAILELQALKGRLGGSSEGLAESLRLRSETLQSAPEATRMQQAGYGAGQAAIGRTITKADYDAFEVSVGKLQKMEHSDAGAYGSLEGTLALEAKKGDTAEDLKGRFYKEYQVQQPGKFSTFAQYAQQRSEASHYVQNDVLKPEEAAGLLSAFSMGNPESAGERLDQAMRTVSAGMLRNRKMKVADGHDYVTSSEYFSKQLKMTDQNTPLERIMAVANDLQTKQADAAKAGKRFDPEIHLGEHGITNQEDRQTMMMMAGLNKSGIWQGAIAPLMNAPMDPNAIDKRWKETVGREPTAAAAAAKLSEDAMNVQKSLSPEGQLQSLKEIAFNRLKAQGKISGDAKSAITAGPVVKWLNDWWRVDRNGAKVGWSEQLDLEAQDQAVEAARVRNIKAEVPMERRSGYADRPAYMGDEALADLVQRTQQAGGNPFAEAARDAKRTANAVEELLKRTTPPTPKAMNNPPPQLRHDGRM